MNQEPLQTTGYSTDEENAASAVASLIAAPPPSKSSASMDTTESSTRSTGMKRSSIRDSHNVKVARRKLTSSFRGAKEPQGDPYYESEGDDGPSWSGADTKPASLTPAPFFYYRNHSQEEDDDPLSPLTLPGRIPNFPAKMHAILCNPEYADVIAWMPHGRSWRVLKPREFEIRVIPTYFEHSKFSSFIRQANGWGFRRVTQGRERKSYYHEFFLRGLPHLCKKMRRLGTSEKPFLDPDHEPDFYKISDQFPLPESTGAVNDETQMVEQTIKEGPKARMPVNYAAFVNGNNASLSAAAERVSGPASTEVADSVLSEQHLLERLTTDSSNIINKNTNRPSAPTVNPPTTSTAATESDMVVLEQQMLENALKDSSKTKAATVAAKPNLLENILCNKLFSETSPTQMAFLIADENRRRQEQQLQIAAAQRQQQQLHLLQQLQTLSSSRSDLLPTLPSQRLNPFGVSPNINQLPLQTLMSGAAPSVQRQPNLNDLYNRQASSSSSSSSIASHLQAAATHLRNAYALALNPSANPNPMSSDDVLSKFLSDMKK